MMLLLGLEYGGVSYPWASAIVICLIVFGAVTLVLFALVEWKIPRYPLVPLRLFRDPSIVASYAVCFWQSFAFISGSYFLPVYFQTVLGVSPLLSGVYLIPYVLALSLASAGAGILIRKTGHVRPPIWAGLAGMTVGFGLYINFPARADWPRLVLFQIVAGLGVGPNFQAPLIAVQSRLRPADIASATATFGFIRNMSTAISVVIGGVIYQNQLAVRSPALANPPASIPPDVLQRLSVGEASSGAGLVAGLPDAQRDAVRAVFAQSLSTLWIFYTVSSFVGLLMSFGIRRKKLTEDHTVTKTGLAAQEEGRRQANEERALRKASRLLPKGIKKIGSGDVEKAETLPRSEETSPTSAKAE